MHKYIPTIALISCLCRSNLSFFSVLMIHNLHFNSSFPVTTVSSVSAPARGFTRSSLYLYHLTPSPHLFKIQPGVDISHYSRDDFDGGKKYPPKCKIFTPASTCIKLYAFSLLLFPQFLSFGDAILHRVALYM